MMKFRAHQHPVLEHCQSMKSSIFQDVTLSSPENINQYFRVTYHFNFQGQRLSQARNNIKAARPHSVISQETELSIATNVNLKPNCQSTFFLCCIVKCHNFTCSSISFMANSNKVLNIQLTCSNWIVNIYDRMSFRPRILPEFQIIFPVY